jgi:hypothetical protein
LISEDLNIFQYHIPCSEIKISREIILKSLGYNDNISNGLVDDLIDEYLIKAATYIHPQGGFRIFPEASFSLGKDWFEIDGVKFECGKIISSQLKKSSSAALFAVSIGSVIDGLIKKLNDENDLVAAYIVNTIGSEAAEQTAEIIEKMIAVEIKKNNWKHTNRLSPGYCEWSVAEQHKLFSLLPENFSGIKLTNSALMTPIKSISGIVGIGPNVEKKEYVCSICNLENCYRRKQNG